MLFHDDTILQRIGPAQGKNRESTDSQRAPAIVLIICPSAGWEGQGKHLDKA